MSKAINEGIIKKIKGLLAIANDEKNDEESQSAFVMAQKLMMKHNISQSEVVTKEESKSIGEDAVTVYKTLLWWELTLSNVIAKNFRVKNFTNSQRQAGDKNRKSNITFLGFDSDVELAKEMFILAYDVLVHHTKEFVEKYYAENSLKRTRGNTAILKNSYMRGFLSAMNEKFEEQVAQMKQEYGLMVLVPAEVEEAFDNMFKGNKSKRTLNTPEKVSYGAYQTGFSEGKEVDYTKSTLADTL